MTFQVMEGNIAVLLISDLVDELKEQHPMALIEAVPASYFPANGAWAVAKDSPLKSVFQKRFIDESYNYCNNDV